MSGALAVSTLDAVSDIPETSSPAELATRTGGTGGSDASGSKSLRHRMRAYIRGDAIRLACLLRDLSPVAGNDGHDPAQNIWRLAVPITRDRIASLWAQRWPDHALHTGRGAVRARIAHAIAMLRTAGICLPYADSTDIAVADFSLLAMSAGNLEIVVGDDGLARTPDLWPRSVAVPDELHALVDDLVIQAVAAATLRPASGNLRYQLRAFTQADPVRLAAILLALDEHGTVARHKIAPAWRQWWPRHSELTGNGRIAVRVSRGLTMLRAAGVCHHDHVTVHIDDPGLLVMAGANVAVICGGDGFALPPSQWPRRPTVPAHLQALEDELHDKMVREQLTVPAGGRTEAPGDDPSTVSTRLFPRAI